MGISCSLCLPRNRNRNIKLAGVRFKARKRKKLFTQVADWWNSLPADAADTRSPHELRESKISTQKKDLNWVIIQTTDSGNPLMWKWRAWVRIRGKHHICLHSSYSSLGVHFWRQTVPLFSWSVLLAPCLVGLSLLGQEHSWVLGRTASSATLTLCSSLPRSVRITMDGKLRAVVVFQPFHCPKRRSQPGGDALPSGTPAVTYQRHQPHLLRAVLQSRWCVWPKRNRSPAHKQ